MSMGLSPLSPGVVAVRYAAALQCRVLPGHWVGVDGLCSCKDPSCELPGIHPVIEPGHKYASTNPEAVGEWWKLYGNASVLVVPTGFMGISVPALWGETARNEHESAFKDVPTIDGRGWLTFLTLLQDNDELKPLAEVQRQYQARGARVRVLDAQDYIPLPPSCKGSRLQFVWLSMPFALNEAGFSTPVRLRGAGGVVTGLSEVAGEVYGKE